MKKNIKLLFLLLIIAVTLLFLIFLINQVSSIYTLAQGLHPFIGQAVLYFLIIFFTLVIIIPLIYILKLPKPLKMPEDKNSNEYQEYIKKLRKRLSENPDTNIKKENLTNEEYVEKAINKLDKSADAIIEDISEYIFVSTSISQHGVLDAVIVLISQIKIIWKVAHIYKQRPGIREIIKLYINVGGTALLVREIDDFELIEDQLEPVIATALGSSLSRAVPMVNTVFSVLVNSIVRGSANTFLSLRVGIITKRYCKPLHKVEKKSRLKKMASREAGKKLANVLSGSVQKVIKSVLKVTSKVVKDKGKAGKEKVKKSSKDIAQGIVSKINSII